MAPIEPGADENDQPAGRALTVEFSGKIWFWRGPSPYFFVTVPAQPSRDIKAISKFVTYGWGVIPVRVRIGKFEWTTSLFPKDGRYLVPINAKAQKAENLAEGDTVTLRLDVFAKPKNDQPPPGTFRRKPIR